MHLYEELVLWGDIQNEKIAKKLLMFVAILGIVATTVAATKIDVSAAKGSTVVYVSTGDVCYHNDGCKNLDGNKMPIQLELAVANGFTKCTICKAPNIDGATVQKSAGAGTTGDMVWLSATGDKYHSRNNCGKMNPNKAYQVTVEEAKAKGKKACKKCF